MNLKNMLCAAALLFSSLFAAAQTKEDTIQSFRQQLFPGGKLAAGYRFKFNAPFQELPITTADGKKLDAILFKAKDPKGVIFYLHGNNGGLDKWGKLAETYTDLHYDFFVFDYRGYGKSEGAITNEDTFYSDARIA